MTFAKTAAIAVLSLVAVAAPANAANLVTNGGFETTSSPINSEIGFGGYSVAGWTSTASGYNLLFGNPGTNAVNHYGATDNYFRPAVTADTQPGGGGNFVALDGDSVVRGALTQTINGLTAGKGYVVSFDWASSQLANESGTTTEFLTVGFGGVTQNTAILTEPTGGFSGWKTVSFYFVPTSSSALLSFLSVGTPSGLPPMALLDNVSVTAVPEPATWALLLAGFGMVGYAARRRRTGIVAA